MNITWLNHATIPGRIVADAGGRHMAWIDPFDWGGHTVYIVRSWVRDLNDGSLQFSDLDAAKQVVESTLAGRPTPTPSDEFASGDMIHIKDLDRVKHLVKIKKVAELASLNPSSIAQKINRGTELSVAESKAMMEAMYSVGVIVKHQP